MPSPFDWSDPLRLDDQLETDERALRDAVRDYARGALLPRVVAAFRHGEFDREILREMGGLGMLGLSLDGPGCPGGSHVAYGLAAREIEAVDSGYRSALSVQSSLVMYPIHAFGSQEQRQRWLPALAAGTAVGCFGLTEPDHGSDPGGMKTRATPDAGGWRLDGAKTWITNAPIADVLLIWAKDPDDVIRGFLV